MTFEEALPYLKSGKTIKRESTGLILFMEVEERWNGSKIKYLVTKNSDGIKTMFNTNMDSYYGFPSIFATDWIVID